MQSVLNFKLQTIWPGVMAGLLCFMVHVGSFAEDKNQDNLFLFENDQLLLQFNCQGNCEPFNHASVARFFKLYFRNATVKTNMTGQQFTPLLRHQYKLKVAGDVLTVNYFDLAENVAQKVSQQFCADHQCEVVVKEQQVSSPQFLHLIKNKQLFSFQAQMPESFVKKILQASDYDQYFLGSTIKVIEAKTREQPPTFEFATILVKHGQRLHLFQDQLKIQHLDLIKKMTQADCAFFKNIHEWIYCKDEEILKLPKSLRLKLTTAQGPIIVQNSSAWEQTLLQKMMKDLNAQMIEEDHTPHLSQENDFTIEYRKRDQTVVVFYGAINSKLRDMIHSHMTQSYASDAYNIYQQKSKQSILVVQNKMPRNQDLLNMLDTGLQEKSCDLSLGLINRTQEITAPTDLSYLKRDKLSSLSTIAAKLQMFPSRSTWGGGAGFEFYQVNNQAIDGSNVVDIGSQNSQYHAHLSHRFFPKNKYAKAMLVTSLGVEQRNFNVDSNSSIGSLSYMLQYLSLDLKLFQDLYKFNFLARSGFINGATQSFQSVQDFSSTSGMFLDLQAIFSREITKKIDLNLQAGLRQDKLQLNSSDVTVQEFNLALGLTYHWGEK